MLLKCTKWVAAGLGQRLDMRKARHLTNKILKGAGIIKIQAEIVRKQRKATCA